MERVIYIYIFFFFSWSNLRRKSWFKVRHRTKQQNSKTAPESEVMFYQQLQPTSKPNVNCHFLRVSLWPSEWSYTSKTTSSRSLTARRSREVVMTATTVHQSASLLSRHSLDRAAGGGGGGECYQPAGGREGGRRYCLSSRAQTC